jgi:hypothetical protein
LRGNVEFPNDRDGFVGFLESKIKRLEEILESVGNPHQSLPDQICQYYNLTEFRTQDIWPFA